MPLQQQKQQQRQQQQQQEAAGQQRQQQQQKRQQAKSAGFSRVGADWARQGLGSRLAGAGGVLCLV